MRKLKIGSKRTMKFSTSLYVHIRIGYINPNLTLKNEKRKEIIEICSFYFEMVISPKTSK